MLRPAETLALQLNRNIKQVCMTGLFILFSVYFLMHNSGFFVRGRFISYTRLHVWGFIALVMLCIVSIEEPLGRVRWNRLFLWLFLLCGLGLIITGLIHPIGDGYLFFGVMLVTVYPCLYYIWSCRGDCTPLFDAAANAQVITGLIYFVVFAVLFSLGRITPLADNRIPGTMLNGNYFSTYGTCLLLSALYLIYRKRKEHGILIWLYVSVVIGLYVTLLGQSRLSTVICAGCVLIYCIYAVKARKADQPVEKNADKKKRMLAIAAVMLLAAGAVIVIIQGNDSTIFDRFASNGRSPNDYTAGRIWIWSNYARHLNLFGNDFSQVDWTELTGDTVRHAHNNFLEYGYRCGVIAASLFIIFQLITGIKTLIYLFSKRYTKDCYLFAIFFMINYTLESLFDVATMSMERYSSFFFYILLCAVFADLAKTPDDLKGNEKCMPE